MADKKIVPTLAHMATNPKERGNTSRALANIGERHELIIKALQEGYSFRDISESLKQHDGIDVAPETIRRHYGKGKKRRRNSRTASNADSPAEQKTTQPPPQIPPELPAKPTQAATNAFDRVGRAP